MENHQQIIATLCPELRVILERELEAGNTVVESWDDWGTAVMLARPFLLAHPLVEGIEFRRVNDPHYWLAEYLAVGLEQFVACRF